MSAVSPEHLISLFGLPDHLRKTLIALTTHEYATAQDIADTTKRARAVESSYLNTLVNMGLAKKQREGRKYRFSTGKVKEEIKSLYKQIQQMPSNLREIMCEDMMTALENRVRALSRSANNN